MSRITEQSRPLWERAANPRGHKSSIEKALKAHRSQVNDRNDRTASSQKTTRAQDQFFPRVMRPDPPNAEKSAGYAEAAPASTSHSSAEAKASTSSGPSRQRGMSDIYSEYSMNPVRSLAPTLVENESIEELAEVRSDDVPTNRRSIDYLA